MLKIDSSYVNFAQDIERKALTFCKNQQAIKSGSRWIGKIKNFFESDQKQLISLGKSCNALFDRVEKMPTLFSLDESQTKEQRKCYAACLKTSQAVMPVLASSESHKVKIQLEALVQRVAALKYRIEAVNGGVNCSAVDQSLADKLCGAAVRWKNNHPLIINKQITSQERKKLEEASCYPEFANAALASVYLQESFFNWALRDNNGVSQFVEFPATSMRIKSAFLAARIGRLGGNMFLIEKKQKEDSAQGVTEKVISLPFFIRNKVEYLSILDESKEVELLNGWRLTINKVLNSFARKNREVGSLEFFESTGITNWNCHELGPWNPEKGAYDRIDLTKDEWWTQLNILEEVSKEKLEARLGEALGVDEWVVCAKSARTTPDMDLDGRHGYIEIAIPTGRGSYAIYPFGNFASSFPNSSVELVKFIANTVKGKIAYPDENFFYSHRQQASHPVKLTKEQEGILMRSLQKELIKARFGHVIFQFGGENCAYWAQKVLHSIDSKMPNFYKIDFLDSDPLNPVLGNIFNFIRNLPRNLHRYAIKMTDTLLGSGRKLAVFEYHQRVYKSHKHSPVRNEFVIYQPGYLHKQIEEGKIKGVINIGNC